jgi:hypothetical protein
LKAAIIELAERTAEAGLFAREMQILVGETRFDAWFCERKVDCTLPQAKAFMRFADRRQALSDSFRRTLLALPEVAENEKREDGEQMKIPKPPCPWLSALMKATEQLNLAKEQLPIEQWPQAHLVTLQDSLRPFVELNNKLKELCAD